MKRLYAIALAIAVLASSCNENHLDGRLEAQTVVDWINVTPREVVLNGKGSNTELLNVESVETPWSIDNYSADSWFTLSSIGGDGRNNESISVKAKSENSQTTDRISIISLVSRHSGFTIPITVLQKSSSEYISVSSDTDLTSLIGQSHVVSLTVNTNLVWDIVCDSEWIEISDKNANSVTLTIQENPFDYRRRAIVFIWTEESEGNPSQTVTLNIMQQTATIAGVVDEIRLGCEASETNVSFDAESSWRAYSEDAWLTVSEEQGSAGNNAITIYALENNTIYDRNGTIWIGVYDNNATAYGKQVNIQVYQEAKQLKTLTESLTFSSAEEAKTIAIESNTQWNVTDKPDWVVIDKTEGEGDCELYITAYENINSSERNGIVRFNHPTLSLGFEIYVTQEGRYLDTSSDCVFASDTAGFVTRLIECNGSWNATTSEDWIRVGPTSGVGSQEITLVFDENAGDDERYGNVVISSGDQNLEIPVTQYGKYLSVSTNALEFDAIGGEKELWIDTKSSWKTRVEYNDSQYGWLTVTGNEGESIIRVSVADNVTLNKRTAILYIDQSGGKNWKIYVSQQGRTLYVDKGDLVFLHMPNQQTIVVTADGDYSVTPSENWISVERINDILTVGVEQNDSEEAREGYIQVVLNDCLLSIDIPVLQSGARTFIGIDGFGGEFDWSSSNSAETGITIKGYTTDINWDNAKTTNE